MSLGFFVGAECALYVALWVPVAYATGVMLPEQMLAKYPESRQVIPLILDFYVWADLFFFCPLIGYIVEQVSDQWSPLGVIAMLALGLAAAVAFQLFVVVPGKFPCTLGGAGRTTVLGYLHIPFFAVAFAVTAMFVFTRVPVSTVLVVAATYAVIIPIDILVPLHLIRKWMQIEWAPNVFNEEPRLFWMISGSWVSMILVAATKIVVQRATA